MRSTLRLNVRLDVAATLRWITAILYLIL